MEDVMKDEYTKKYEDLYKRLGIDPKELTKKSASPYS
jgi:hypothetical protein